ncbi:UNVERIFIED_CONTAM: hypothetical protein K2H54_005572 [Gekko kuhli]
MSSRQPDPGASWAEAAGPAGHPAPSPAPHEEVALSPANRSPTQLLPPTMLYLAGLLLSCPLLLGGSSYSESFSPNAKSASDHLDLYSGSGGLLSSSEELEANPEPVVLEEDDDEAGQGLGGTRLKGGRKEGGGMKERKSGEWKGGRNPECQEPRTARNLTASITGSSQTWQPCRAEPDGVIQAEVQPLPVRQATEAGLSV